MEPHEFRSMVKAIRIAEKALGKVRYGICEQEAKSRVFRKSLFAVKDVLAGQVLTEDNIRSIHSGQGMIS
jgi:pseudaminic acid synthase